MENVVIKAVTVKNIVRVFVTLLPSLSRVVFGFLSDTGIPPHSQDVLCLTMTLQMLFCFFFAFLPSVDSDRL